MTSWKKIGMYPKRKAEIVTMRLMDKGMQARIGSKSGSRYGVHVAKSKVEEAKKYIQKQDWPKILKKDREYWKRYFADLEKLNKLGG